MYEQFQGGGRPEPADPEEVETLEEMQTNLKWIGSLYWIESDFSNNALDPALSGNLATVTNAFAPVQIVFASDENLRASFDTAISGIIPPFNVSNPRANTVGIIHAPGRVLVAGFYKITRNPQSVSQQFGDFVENLNTRNGGSVLQKYDNAKGAY